MAVGISANLARATDEKVIWDHWYTVTVNKTLRYQYYNERMSQIGTGAGGKVHLQNKVWKKEEDFINEEHLGVFSALPPAGAREIIPLFYNFYSTYRNTETKIDGTVKDGVLSVMIKQGDKVSPVIKKTIPKTAFFSTFFPYWLGKNLKSMVIGKTQNFSSILEDNIEVGFSPVSGTARLEKSDAYADQTKTKKITVDFRGVRSIWWVDAQGAAVKIDNSSQQAIIQRVKKEEAEKFLK